MRKIIQLILLVSVFTGCATINNKGKESNSIVFQSVSVDTLLSDKISIRAILTDQNSIWYAADKGRFGYYNLAAINKFETKIVKDGLEPEFRSIAKTSSDVFILNIGNPAFLYRISKDGKQPKLVYEESGEKVFYDSMQFWNDKEGIAVGDPVEDCFSIIITRDGGNSWQKTSCDKLPKVVDGEAAFAASNTNIIIKGKKTWLVSGGKKSRVFFSPDKGKTWQVFETPIVQGLAMTGIFTADFYDEKTGFIAGGNYDVQNQNFGNKAHTIDGGKTWNLIAENQGFGYASCIQYVPDSKGKQLVSVGTSGLYYSADAGASWKKMLDNKELYTIRFLDKATAIAGGRNMLLRINFK